MRVGVSVLREATVGCQYVRLRRSAVYAGRGVTPGGGEPVVLLPGFMCDDRVLGLMHGWLRRQGYVPHGAGLSARNTGCAEDALAEIEAHIERIAAASGRRVAVLGYSRGGHFARVLGVRRPDLVSGVVTLGAPSLDPRCVHLVAAAPAVAVMLLGTAGVPGFFGYSCFRGDCCERFRADLVAPLDDGVGYVALRSSLDGIVDHRYTPDPGARHVEIDTTHVGYIVNHRVFAAVADALRTFAPTASTTTTSTKRARGARV
jgi:pimeloyl-ACP methyl ester carboxylesterase